MTIAEAWMEMRVNQLAICEQVNLVVAGKASRDNAASIMTAIMARQDALRAAIAARAVLS